MRKITNFIAGEWHPAKAGATSDVYDPASGQIYAQAPSSNALDVIEAIAAANKAFAKWSETSTKERAGYLNKIADRLEARLEEFAEAESRDVGKPLWVAREGDIPRAIACFRLFAAMILGQSTQTFESDAPTRAIQYVRREPLGVTGLIGPWNFPLYTLCYKLAPSLAMGNTAVCKPSELTPMTIHMLTEIFQEVGLPPGVCNVVYGKGEVVGATLVQHPGVPMISFTGGTETAQGIQRTAAPMFKRLSLELGGKNANIIMDDADLKKAVPMALRASFINSGQVCLSGSRLFVQDGIHDEFMAEFLKATKDLKVGDPSEKETFMGPLVSAEQRTKVQKAIAQAVSEKGRIVAGGGVPTHLPEKLKDGYFLEPTVIEDLTNCSDLWQTEIFGPVVTTMKFKYAHEAVKWANTSPYGLSASLFTQNLDRAHKIAAQIQAGTVWVNTWSLRDPRVPFGGFKASGIGREGGDESLRTYSEMKTVCVALS